MQISDSVAVITGGVSGLGFGAARRMVDHGASVVMLDINEERGTQAAGELGQRSRFVACDVSRPEDVAAAVAGAREAFGSIDILVNAAGVAPAQRVVARDGTLFDLDLFKFTVAVNLIGMFDVTRHAAAAMADNAPGENPGIMDTPLLAGAPQELRDALAQLHVFPKRLGTAEDFAHLVQAIVENPMINGEVIRLDAATRMPPK